MTTMRRFYMNDLFRFNPINADCLTETYNIRFYQEYMARWPDLMLLAEAPNGRPMGYIIGKAEGSADLLHGHVTALSVGPEYRRMGLAETFMRFLEEVSDKTYHGYFMDLFVRVSNQVAICMYEKFGYSVYRRVLEYYAGDEDAYDMRKALPRDVDKKSIIPLQEPITPEQLEWH